MSERLRLRVLGGVDVEGVPNADAPVQAKRIALLATVALSGSTPVTRDKVLGHLWPDSPEERGRHALSNALYEVRKELGADVIRSVGKGLELDRTAIAVDALEFERAVEEDQLEDAADLYRGPLLDGFYVESSADFEHWLDDQRERLAALYGQTLEQLAARAEAAGELGTAVEWWRRLATHDRYSSRIALGLVRALASSGERGAALRHAETHERVLREELGLAADDSGPTFVAQVRAELSRDAFGDLDKLAFEKAVVEDAEDDAPEVDASAVRLRTKRAIAVLPFSDMSPQGDQDYFCEGMAEEIINALVKVDGLRVASRASAFRAWKEDAEIVTIGRTLSVGRVLQGSVRTAGDRLRVTAQLTDVDTERLLWSERYDRGVEDVFAVQDEIAAGIVSAVELQLEVESQLMQASPGVGPGDTKPVVPSIIPPRERATDLEAYHLYLRGRHLRYKTDLLGAIKCFEAAVERDPSYVDARLGIAEACAVSLDYGLLPPAKARAAAVEQIDWVRHHHGVTATVRAIEGWLAWLYDWDANAAEAAFLDALELDPESVQRGWYSCLLATRGHGGLDDHLRTIKAVDPESPYVRAGVALALVNAGRSDEAIDEAQTALAMDPSALLATWVMGLSLAAGEQWTAAIETLSRAVDMSRRAPLMLSSAGWAMAANGLHDEAHAILEELDDLSRERYVDPGCEAWILSELDDADATRAKFEQALAMRSALLAWTQLPPNRRLAQQPEQAALIQTFRGESTQIRDEPNHEALGDLDEPKLDTVVEDVQSGESEVDGSRSALPTSPAIAVLPFSDLSPARDQEYFCEGMAEEIINALVHVDGLHVASRASAFRIWEKDAKVATIGRALSVGGVLQGSVRRAGDRLRVTAQLTDVDTELLLWSERYDRSLEDVFSVQDEIATGVVDAVRSQLLHVSTGPEGGEAEPLGAPVIPPRERATDLEAYHFYLRGRHLRYSRLDLIGAAKCFEAAVERDPSYVVARLGIAEAFVLSLGYAILPPDDAHTRAVEQLDWVRQHHGVTPLGLAIEAFDAWLYHRDPSSAETAFTAALRLDPRSLPARSWHSILLATRGAYALDEALHGLRALDPTSPYVRTVAGLSLLNAGRFDEAIEQTREALAVQPDAHMATWVAGLSLAADEQWTAAIETLGRAVDLSQRMPFALGVTGWAMAASGRRAGAGKLLEELTELSEKRYVDPLFQAWILSELDDADATRAKFEEALAMRSALLAWTQFPPNRRLAQQPEQAALIQTFRGEARQVRDEPSHEALGDLDEPKSDTVVEDVHPGEPEVESRLLQTPRDSEAADPEPVAGPVIPPRERVADLEAYHLYLRGRHLRFSKGDMLGAAESFEAAVKRQPSYLEARLGIAEALTGAGAYAIVPLIETHARAVEQLDWVRRHCGITPDVRAIEGWLAWHYDWDPIAAGAAFREAIELDPKSLLARSWYTSLLATQRHEAFDEELRSLQALDPRSPQVRGSAGISLLLAGRTDEAIEQTRMALAMDPGSRLTTWRAGLSLAAGQQWTAAIETVSRAVDLSPRSPFTLGVAGWVMAANGLVDDAKAILRNLEDLREERYVDPVFEAWILSELDDAAATRAKFEEALAMRSGPLAWTQLPANRRLAEQPEQAALIQKFRGPSLDGSPSAAPPSAAPDAVPIVRPLPVAAPTSRGPSRYRRPAIGLTALAGAVLIGWGLISGLGSRPPDTPLLTVLADFEDEAGDPGLSVTVTEALRTDLTSEAGLRLLSPDRVRAGRGQMGLEGDAPLTAERASELAQRAGAGAVLTGSIQGAGGGYILIAQLQDPLAGNAPEDATFRETAASADGLISAIERLSRAVLHHVERRAPREPERLASVTTRSLPALRLYSEAQRLSATVGEVQQIPDLLSESVTLDSMFAGAHLQLGLWRWRAGQLSLAQASLSEAYELRDGLTPAERGIIEAEHKILFEGDLRGGIAAYEAQVTAFPDDVRSHFRLGESYAWLRDWVSAEHQFDQATKIDPGYYPAWNQLYINQWRQGKEPEGRATLTEIETRFPTDARVPPLRGLVLSSEGRFAEAQAVFQSLEGQASRGPMIQARIVRASATLSAIQGRLAAADIEYRRAGELFRQAGSPRDVLNTAATRAYLWVAVAGDFDGARTVLESELARTPLDSVPLLDRPYLDLAIARASLRDVDSARSLLAAHETVENPGLARWLPPNPGSMPFELEPLKELAYGIVELADYNVPAAIDHLRQSVATSTCEICGLAQLGTALEHAGETGRAFDVYERFLETRWFGRIQAPPTETTDGVFRGMVLRRLATLHDAAGHPADAIKYYREFVELWENADQELQGQVRDARDRVTALEQGAGPLQLSSPGPDAIRP